MECRVSPWLFCIVFLIGLHVPFLSASAAEGSRDQQRAEEAASFGSLSTGRLHSLDTFDVSVAIRSVRWNDNNEIENREVLLRRVRDAEDGFDATVRYVGANDANEKKASRSDTFLTSFLLDKENFQQRIFPDRQISKRTGVNAEKQYRVAAFAYAFELFGITGVPHGLAEKEIDVKRSLITELLRSASVKSASDEQTVFEITQKSNASEMPDVSFEIAFDTVNGCVLRYTAFVVNEAGKRKVFSRIRFRWGEYNGQLVPLVAMEEKAKFNADFSAPLELIVDKEITFHWRAIGKEEMPDLDELRGKLFSFGGALKLCEVPKSSECCEVEELNAS